MMNSPELAQLIGAVGHYIRYESELPDADREIVINATARHFDCPYEWAAHAPIAREAGVDNAVLDAIADESDPVHLPEPASTLVTYAWSLLADHDVEDDVFAAALERYGESGIVELTATVGYYSLIASVLNAFEVLPEESAFA